MSLTVRDIEKIFETLAPSNIKESYDNVGLMVGNSEDKVKSILISLDCTMDVLEEAITKDCNLIINHHPMLFFKQAVITTNSFIGKKVIKAAKNNINIYASHTNLDSIKGGLNDIVMNILGFENYSTMELALSSSDGVSGVGRICQLDSGISLLELCERVKSSLHIDCLRYVGDERKIIKRIAVINGSGEDFFKRAIELKADCVITGDTRYHHVSDCMEQGVAVIDAGHFETEWPAMKVFATNFQNLIRSMGYNNSVIISECNKSPYKYK